ncbi:hypothetical protein [Streptomyces sp. WAC06614]|uniref:hypothetical protein n=1 Tax=Streptomyces sp. WAC06614 TaxID=2487416 RepID=UPI000F7A4F52|nr:hypothetical protein [Streptomyces sp. WAC06614]RSS79243.1 hypothetical protein EF918_18135 [Streptomyces sp. WAC06614]
MTHRDRSLHVLRGRPDLAAGPADGGLLAALGPELAALGAFRHAARARRLQASLQDEPWDRAAALLHAAELERRAGDLDAA